MMQKTPTWAVVATVDEPPALVRVFVGWYRRLGASEIFLYFDGAEDPAADDMPNIVTIFRCDAAHWRRLGKRRPDKHQIRQARNATDAYRRMQSDWLLHADADEFVWAVQPVTDSLAGVARTTDAVVVPVAERIFLAERPAAPLCGPFRRPFRGRDDAGRALFGPDYDLTLRGLTGHVVGKSFARAGRGLSISVHRPKPSPSAKPGAVPAERADGLELLHFDGLTRLHWIYKLLRAADAFQHHNGMVPSPQRQRQIDAVLRDRAGAYVLHDQLKLLDADTVQVLQAQGLLCDPPFDPFGGGTAQLTTEGVDDWLRQKGLDLSGLSAPFDGVSSV